MNIQETYNLKNEAFSLINQAKSTKELEGLKIAFLGRKGKINQLFSKIAKLPKEERIKFAQAANEIKQLVQEEIDNKSFSENQQPQTSEYFDPTLPGKRPPQGHLHPITQAIESISSLFENIGFVRVRYPEVEWDWYAFESLNMPKNHPARDEWETFFIDTPENEKHGKMVLTPHTSSGLVREMQRLGKPPIRMINIAKTYRPNLDAIHTPMFHQFEGLVIDKDINITHLKGTIEYFAKEFFGENRKIRLRPFNFRFTEPSFEIDVSCGICNGKGIVNGKKCKVCKSGWLEIGGCGMVHPYVLKMGGIDPEKYSGWAFGFGPERCFMMKDEIKTTDLRMFYDSDIRFLEQF